MEIGCVNAASDTIMETFDTPAHALLRQIADALGVPVQRLFAGTSSAEPAASADECLQVWSRIRTDEGRQQALQALRAIAALEQA